MMLNGLFPEDVALAWGDSRDASAELLPGEVELVANAVPKRQLEFANARECARRALGQLGVARQALLMAPSREPLWPEGIVGSLTHTNGLCAAVAARASRYRGLGVDVEPALPLPENLLSRICRDEEIARLGAFRALSAGVAARLVFSAKEALYKCQFPVTRSFLGFEEVTVELEEDGRFSARVLLPLLELASTPILPGRWSCRDGFLLTAVWFANDSFARSA